MTRARELFCGGVGTNPLPKTFVRRVLAEGRLAKSNFSFSPGFSLGSELACNLGTVLTVSDRFQCFKINRWKRLTPFPVSPNPKLKLGENEKVECERVSEGVDLLSCGTHFSESSCKPIGSAPLPLSPSITRAISP